MKSSLKIAIYLWFSLCVMPVLGQGSALKPGRAGVVIIANQSVPADSISMQEVLDFYMLDANKWQDGSLVYLFDQKNDTDARHVFYRYIQNKPREMKKVWMRVILSGEGQTPRVVRSEEEMVQKVAARTGAIGYVDAALVTDDVKVLAVISSPGNFDAERNR